MPGRSARPRRRITLAALAWSIFWSFSGTVGRLCLRVEAGRPRLGPGRVAKDRRRPPRTLSTPACRRPAAANHLKWSNNLSMNAAEIHRIACSIPLRAAKIVGANLAATDPWIESSPAAILEVATFLPRRRTSADGPSQQSLRRRLSSARPEEGGEVRPRAAHRGRLSSHELRRESTRSRSR